MEKTLFFEFLKLVRSKQGQEIGFALLLYQVFFDVKGTGEGWCAWSPETLYGRIAVSIKKNRNLNRIRDGAHRNIHGTEP